MSVPKPAPGKSGDVGDDLVERLRREHGWYEDGGNGFDPYGYTDDLERHVREGVRVNVGLMRENAELRRRVQGQL